MYKFSILAVLQLLLAVKAVKLQYYPNVCYNFRHGRKFVLLSKPQDQTQCEDYSVNENGSVMFENSCIKRVGKSKLSKVACDTDNLKFDEGFGFYQSYETENKCFAIIGKRFIAINCRPMNAFKELESRLLEEKNATNLCRVDMDITSDILQKLQTALDEKTVEMGNMTVQISLMEQKLSELDLANDKCEPLDESWIKVDNKNVWFKGYVIEKDWSEASTFCYEQKSSLVMILDQTEKDKIDEIVEMNQSKHWWLGLIRIDGNAKDGMRWLNGATVPNWWAPNEPNGPDSRCGQIYPNKTFDDTNCTYKNFFICEKRC